jgi:hypothetical protein
VSEAYAPIEQLILNQLFGRLIPFANWFHSLVFGISDLRSANSYHLWGN